MIERGVAGRRPRPLLFAMLLLAAMLAACRMTPSVSRTSASDDIVRLAGELADYAVWVRQQPDEALQDEIRRLEAAGNSPDPMLHLALLLSQPASARHDPERATELLRRLLDAGPAASAQSQLAQVLLAILPPTGTACGPAACADSSSLVRKEEEQRQRELRLRLQSVELQLGSERAQRARLEKQLEALKLLEEKIGSRETTPSP